MENKEIEEMRSQISLLRNKLEKQQIINDSMVAAAIQKNVAAIEWRTRIPLAAGIFAVIYCPFAFGHVLHLSMPFIVFAEVMLVWSIIVTCCQLRMVPTAADRGSDIAEFVRCIDKFDRFRKRMLMVDMVLLVVFFAWFLKDLAANYATELFLGMLVAVCVGLALGLVIGLKNYFGISRRLRDMRRDAEMLRQE